MESSRPTVFFLHGLGLSRRLFEPVIDELGNEFDTVALDLPGFGDRAHHPVPDVESTVDDVVASIRQHGATRWLLVGHSMGGKIASVVAARTLSGDAPLFGLTGVMLLAGSPPSPEPMADERRADMLSWVADRDTLTAADARTFIDANVGSALPEQLDTVAVSDLRRTSREAWIAWLQRGSREDWSERVGVLDLPSVLVAGGADGDLGPDAQRRLNGPVYPRADLVTLDGAGHLLPFERPREVVDQLRRIWDGARRGPVVPAAVAGTIASDRTNRVTRGALAKRVVADDPEYRPVALSNDQLSTLRAIAGCVVPQDGPSDVHLDLAARIDAQLAQGRGDGWRLATLPTDIDAYRAGLDALHGFAELDAAAQQRRLSELADGKVTAEGARLTASQLADWFTDVRDDLVRIWVTHPATAARMGYDGYANGGDAARQQGFVLLGAGERETWEPTPGSAA